MPILLFLTTYFSNFYLVYLEALLKLSNSTAYDTNNALRGDTHLWYNCKEKQGNNTIFGRAVTPGWVRGQDKGRK